MSREPKTLLDVVEKLVPNAQSLSEDQLGDDVADVVTNAVRYAKTKGIVDRLGVLITDIDNLDSTCCRDAASLALGSAYMVLSSEMRQLADQLPALPEDETPTTTDWPSALTKDHA